MSAIVVYYSRTGQNYRNGSIVELKKGNTERVAEYIAQATGAELFQIETVEPYPVDYMECTEVARREQDEDARPELKSYDADLDAYDTIFVGYPSWWGSCPMCVFSLLERFDLSGKTIAPFCTNEGSGMGASERDLKAVCPGATVVRGLSVFGSDVGGAEDEAASWARQFV
ncbi:MAG: flavodoxin [Coriobacteriales bacterium]